MSTPDFPPASRDHPPLSFADILEAEIADLGQRRADQSSDAPWHRGERAPAGSAVEAAVRLLRREMLDNDVVGLALSGGGIRSATFNLGTLQALAELGLLRRFDYLSTVSGGGYIGGWLAAWIKREGEVGNVEKQLDPNHVKQAGADRWRGDTERREAACVIAYRGPVLDDEPEPVRHLRAYSSYLAPRPGLFSADGWVLIAIYLRNLLLNQSVLLSGVLALLFGMACVIQAFSVAGQVDTLPPALWIVLGLGALAALCRACLYAYHSVRALEDTAAGRPPESVSMRTAMRRLHTGALIPLLIAAVAVSLLALHVLGPGRVEPRWALAPAFALAFGAFHGLFNIRSWKRLVWERKPVNARWLMAGLAAGALGGFLLFASLRGFHELTADSPVRTAAATSLLPPLLLGLFVATTFLQIGVLGGLLGEAEREWWSSLGGWVMMYAAAWLLLFATAVFGTFLVLQTRDSHWAAQATAALTWAASVAGGLWAGHSTQTGSPRAVKPEPGLGTRLKEVLAHVAPAVFLLGLFILVSVFAALLIDNGVPDGWAYLERLNSPYGPKPLEDWVGKGNAWLAMSVCLVASTLLLFFSSFLLSLCADINIFSLQGLYANRLVRCYLGASRRKRPSETSDRPPGAALNSCGPARAPNAITGFDPLDDLPLPSLRTEPPRPRTADRPEHDNDERAYRGPLPLICATLNLAQGEELAWQERKAESFTLGPRHCGSQTTGYRPTERFAGGLSLGTATAISGAALSPNMGYHSEPAITALLTVFNVRLGAWVGNPRRTSWTRFSPRVGLWHLLHEALGRTNARSHYVYLSDGGHFENLGAYELIRRRCRFILLCDAGADPDFGLVDLGNLVRKVRIDLGVRIDIDVRALRPQGDDRRSARHVAVGKIRYGDVDRVGGTKASDADDRQFNADNDDGILVYIKPVMTGDEPADLLNYSKLHPTFPHQSTLDQFFTESQFESYRALGYHSLKAAMSEDALFTFRKRAPGLPRDLFRSLFDYWTAVREPATTSAQPRAM